MATDHPDPTTDRSEAASATEAPWGCHWEGDLVVTRLDVKLADDRTRDLAPLELLTTTYPGWSDELENGDVVNLPTSVAGMPTGLWQRQDDHLVPVTEADYHDKVPQCVTYVCGLCQGCVQERECTERRIGEIVDADKKLTAAAAAADEALRAFSALADWDIGDDLDLASSEREDGSFWLESAARRLRAVQRIIAPHLDKARKLEADIRGD